MDPFNQFLKNKISIFKRNTNSTLLTDRLEKSFIRQTREEARLASRPATISERKRMTPEQISEEDQRLQEREEMLNYEHVVDEIMNLFSA